MTAEEKKQYMKAQEHFENEWHADVRKYDGMLQNVPQEYWIQ